MTAIKRVVDVSIKHKKKPTLTAFITAQKSSREIQTDSSPYVSHHKN